jgi:Pvc16 N-terminal domain
VSDYLAVGGVSAVLCALLNSALHEGPSGLLGASPQAVTATSPDLIAPGPEEAPRLNLFMYYVSLNPALRNLDLPARNGQGEALGNPPLALNLHYLVSAYGAQQFDPEILLAWAMKVFHDTPVVAPATIQAALTGLLSSGSPSEAAKLIGQSTLAEQIEHLRITPETLTTEEIYRLWTAFQTAYRPSTALQVSVVVVQDTAAFASNRRVRQRNVLVASLRSPAISAVAPAIVTDSESLTITGADFVGDAATSTLVSFDGEPGVAPKLLHPGLIEVALPASMQAGTHTLRVQRTVAFKQQGAQHAGFSSSPAPFQLIPTIENASPLSVTVGAPLALEISPAVGQAQQATVYIGDSAFPVDQRPVDGAAASTTLSVTIPTGAKTGTFPLWVEIDGAQSQLASPGGSSGAQIVVS